MTFLLSIFAFPLLMIVIGLLIWQIDEVKAVVKANWKELLLFSIALLIFLDIFTIWHMRQEHFLYYWDFSGFWRRSLEFNAELTAHPNNILKYLYESILFQEYSSFPQLFLTAHTLLLGNTYPRFILAMVNTFVIPSQMLVYILALTIIKRLNIESKITKLSIAFFLIFFTGNILPLILGYVGSVGQIFIALILILVFNLDFSKKQLIHSLLIGILMLFLVFLRRWYSYFALSFFTVFPVSHLINELTLKRFEYKKFTYLLINLFIAGATSLFILIMFFRPLFTTFIAYDYAFAYQSVHYSGVSYAWPWFINFYSPFQVFIALIGIIYGISKKELRFYTLYAVLSIMMIIVVFYQVQVFGSHHYYIINTLFQLLVIYGIISIFDFLHGKTQLLVYGMMSTLLVLNFSLAFLYRDDSAFTNFRLKFLPISTALYAPPRSRDDVDKIRDIVSYLRAEAKPFEYIYVLSGSGILNDDLMRNAFLPDVLNPLPTLEATHHLDTRDGTPSLFFYYTYIVVAEPTQYHNGADYQHVIGLLADGMLNDNDLKPYYYPLETYLIEKNTKVHIFKRIEDIPENIKIKYRKLFKEIYPEYPFLYDFQ